MEGTVADGGERIGNRHACQVAAVIKRTSANRGDRVGDGHAHQGRAGLERIAVNCGDRVGDINASQATVQKRTLTDADNRVGDDSRIAANNQRVARSLNDSVTIVAGIVFRIAAIHHNARQVIAGCERLVTDRGDRVGDGHAFQTKACMERIVADGGDQVGRAVIGDGRGNGHITGITVCTGR